MGLGMANLKCSRILVVAASTAPGSLALPHMHMYHFFAIIPSIFTPASFDQKLGAPSTPTRRRPPRQRRSRITARRCRSKPIGRARPLAAVQD